MLAYKAALHNKTRVTITLEIPQDALTNLNRSSVVAKETASYRTNKAKVLTIEDDSGTTYPYAQTRHGSLMGLLYRVGDVVVDPHFDTNLELEYAGGIHFFVSRRVVDTYTVVWLDLEGADSFRRLSSLYECINYEGPARIQAMRTNGLFECWHPNGQVWIRGLFKDGKQGGVWRMWGHDGKKASELLYTNGKLEGIWEAWKDIGDGLVRKETQAARGLDSIFIGF